MHLGQIKVYVDMSEFVFATKKNTNVLITYLLRLFQTAINDLLMEIAITKI